MNAESNIHAGALSQAPDVSATLAPDEHAPPVPAAFVPVERGGPYLHAMGPLYQRPADDGTVVIALRVTPRHTNTLGVAHGGMLMTLADGSMGINVALARAGASPHQPTVTTTLSHEFLSSARVGDWLEAHTRIRRNGQRIVFVDCVIKTGERDVLHASGTFLPL